ncbi:MAG: ATP-binding protein, partial [Planctomycetes bacterium]|nr:ATP-binding protein [Planctomycetota bacterium]
MSTKLKLTVGTAALAVGVLAPAAAAAVAASAATPFVFWFGHLAVGFGQWVAGYYTNRKASADDAAEQAQIPDAQTLLGNEHLTALLGLAFRAAIQRASNAAEVATHRADLRAMAHAAPGELQRALASEAERFSALRESAVPEIVIRAQQGGGRAPFLEPAEWRELLVPLAERVGANTASGRWIDRVATIVEAEFPSAFKEILKRDRHPNGPTQGRGYAAYEMMIATRILAQLDAADAAATGRFGELIKQVWDTEDRLRERLEILQNEQKSTRSGVESIRRLLEHGLNSFDAFREFYWSQVRKQKLLAELWKQPRFATMLEHRFVGRADLVRSVVEMLMSGSKDAVLLFGAPGFGKSRLLLAIAEDVRRAGVEVAFIHRSVHDLRGQLSRFEGQRGTVLLVWDDVQETNERDAKFFFELDDPS